MLSVANLIRRIKSPFNYNIGFVDISPNEFINERGFGMRKVEWLTHDYNDRWFADPFILDADDDKVIVLAEEKQYGKPGSLVRLTISRKGKRLIKRESILEQPTHLSYPNSIMIGDKVYVYPENSQSGTLTIYEYNTNAQLKKYQVLIDQPLNDSSIIQNSTDGKFYLIATNTEIDPHNHTLLFSADNPLGSWSQVSKKPIINDRRFARPGGNFIIIDNEIYRPAQDCEGAYGNSLHIMKVNSICPWQEEELFHLQPASFKYSYGLHTLNFHTSGLAVIDGNGYAYPIIGRLIGPLLERLIHPSK